MPVFERRHYVALARLVADMSDLDECGREYVADKLSALFRSDNSRYDCGRFYAAADIECPDSRSRMSSDYDALKDDGYAYGVGAGSWVIDGNTTDETAKRILAMLDKGDPEVYDMCPNPLSGEWAGDPTPRDIFERCDVENVQPDEESELLGYWQAGFQLGWETEVVRSCRAILDLFPADLRR